jgi:hypothetical protein
MQVLHRLDTGTSLALSLVWCPDQLCMLGARFTSFTTALQVQTYKY